ncbi:FAD-dependent monooxygenase, partial [Nocardiopsis coralliicola]
MAEAGQGAAEAVPRPRGAGRTRVLVLGAGPVGQTAALLLARHGLQPVLVDAAEGRDPVGSKAIVQQGDVLDVWESVGAGAVAREGLTWSTARTFYREHELFAVAAPGSGGSGAVPAPLPPFVNISQGRTEEILDACLAEQGAAVLWRHRVTGIEQDGAGVTAVCTGPGGEVRLRGAYAVACVGAHGSAVRTALGVRLDGESFDDRFLICDIRADLPGWERERRFYFDPEWNPGRQVLIHPCPDSVFRIDWQVPPDFDLEAEEAEGGLDRRIRQIIGDRPYEVVWRTVYRFHTRVADRMRIGRVLLAGDAAHLYAPFGARGLNSGVHDAENAAWKIAFAARGWGAEEALLESYHAERRAAAQENADITGATMEFLVPRGPGAAAHRTDVLRRAVDDASVHPQVDSGRLSEPFWYPGSPLVAAHPERPPARRPPRGARCTPGPGVLVPDTVLSAAEAASAPAAARGAGTGPCRLRALSRAGGGLTALVVGAGPVPAAAAAALGGAVPVHTAALDPDGGCAAALGAAPGEVWLLRPDAHVAAVADAADAEALARAVRTAAGLG